jgi:hypothetical protein
MTKKRIVLSMIYYPFALGSYIWRALDRRDDVELFTSGPYTADWIPWSSGVRLPMKYVRPINFALPPQSFFPPWGIVKAQLPWKPDLVLQIDAGFHFKDKPDCFTATVGTDPHCLNAQYDLPRSYSDKFFCMQLCYSKPGDIYLPYAFDPTVHFPDPNVTVDTDACLMGLHYETRTAWVNALRARGHTVIYDIGHIYDEYREACCRATLGLNWSSLNDICARVFEMMAMKRVPVINRVPDLGAVGMVENEHYYGFSTLDEAIQKAEIALNNPKEAQEIAENAYRKVLNNDTWDARVQQILQECGLI